VGLTIKREGRVFVPTWNGNLAEDEQIRCKYRTLTMGDMLEVQRTVDVNLFTGIQVDMEDRESVEKQWDLIKYVLDKYTSDWEAINVDGTPLTMGEQVTNGLQANHLELLAEVFAKILQDSLGTGDESKNSDAESEPLNSGSVTTVENVDLPDSKKTETATESTP